MDYQKTKECLCPNIILYCYHLIIMNLSTLSDSLLHHWDPCSPEFHKTISCAEAWSRVLRQDRVSNWTEYQGGGQTRYSQVLLYENLMNWVHIGNELKAYIYYITYIDNHIAWFIVNLIAKWHIGHRNFINIWSRRWLLIFVISEAKKLLSQHFNKTNRANFVHMFCIRFYQWYPGPSSRLLAAF